MNWYLDVLKNYANFSGRARRTEYWMFLLFHYIIVGALAGISYATEMPVLFSIVGLYVLATIIPSIAVSVRRMHDIDKSGWMMLISLIPLIGGIWYLVLVVTEGTNGENSYGPNPKGEIIYQAQQTEQY